MTRKYITQKTHHGNVKHRNIQHKFLCFLSFFVDMPSGLCYLLLIEIAYYGIHSVH